MKGLQKYEHVLENITARCSQRNLAQLFAKCEKRWRRKCKYQPVSVSDDAEILAYVSELSIITKIDAPTLVRTFGEYLFILLYNSSPVNVSHIDNLKDFLTCIDGVIHKEVKRVYPDAYLPSFKYDETPDGDLIMFYKSKRKLCHLSEGLIAGAANHFKQSISIKHPECMHDGAEKCKLVISFED